jgi:hypothetical protein
MSTATAPFTERTERTSVFQKTEPPAPKMLTGRLLGTQLLVRKVLFQGTGLITTSQSAIRDTGEVDRPRNRICEVL